MISKLQAPVERSGILFCLVGPAGGGKTSIAQQLLANNGTTIRKAVSVTTRPKRAGEQEGVSYYFVTRAEFERRVAAGMFFEWEETHGNLYGTLRESINDRLEQGIDTVFDIDIRGAASLRSQFTKNTVVVLVVPPSFRDLESRITKRGPVSESELTRRLSTARDEYEQMLLAYHRGDGGEYLVVNENLDVAVSEAQAILDAERRRLARFAPSLAMRVCGGQ